MSYAPLGLRDRTDRFILLDDPQSLFGVKATSIGQEIGLGFHLGILVDDLGVVVVDSSKLGGGEDMFHNDNMHMICLFL